MYSRTEAVRAILDLYQAIIRLPYLDGRTNTVVNLLRHLPYLRSEKELERLIVEYETVPICYAGTGLTYEGIYPLPEHCVYLTKSVDALGTCLILDTKRGTLTEYTHSESHVVVPWDEYDALPDAEKWTGHYTASVAELVAEWAARYRALVWMLVPNPCRQPTTGRYYCRADSRPHAVELLREVEEYGLLPIELEEDLAPHQGESEVDWERREGVTRRRRHIADLYNVHLSHGWPDNFDKERCKAELLELEKRENAEDKRIIDAMNDDSEMFL